MSLSVYPHFPKQGYKFSVLCHGRLSPQPQHRVVNRNILRGYEVALKGTENRAGTKVSEPVQSGFILSQRQISKLEECHATLCSFSCNCESNLKPDSMFHGRNPFSPGARVIYILLFWWHANKLETHCSLRTKLYSITIR